MLPLWRRWLIYYLVYQCYSSVLRLRSAVVSMDVDVRAGIGVVQCSDLSSCCVAMMLIAGAPTLRSNSVVYCRRSTRPVLKHGPRSLTCTQVIGFYET